MIDDDWQYPVRVVERIPVSGTCVQCAGNDIKRYPVVSDGGWFVVTKCQNCLYSLDRAPWHRLGYIRLAEDNI